LKLFLHQIAVSATCKSISCKNGDLKPKRVPWDFGAVIMKESYYLPGSHASLKVLEFFHPKFKALKVLENRTGAWKSLNFIPQVLESP